jgi:hypothetical protein
MSPLSRLLIAVLALSGALSWGPPTVLGICLDRGTCTMDRPSCCDPATPEGPSVSTEEPPGDCCSCCTKVHVGLGLDGVGPRADVPVAPAPPTATRAFASPETKEQAPAFATLPSLPPPEKVLPLRI